MLGGEAQRHAAGVMIPAPPHHAVPCPSLSFLIYTVGCVRHGLTLTVRGPTGCQPPFTPPRPQLSRAPGAGAWGSAHSRLSPLSTDPQLLTRGTPAGQETRGTPREHPKPQLGRRSLPHAAPSRGAPRRVYLPESAARGR